MTDSSALFRKGIKHKIHRERRRQMNVGFLAESRHLITRNHRLEPAVRGMR